MPLLPAFIPSRDFLQTVLPGLIPAKPSLTHVVASYNRIGTRRYARPVEIVRENELTTLLFPELTLGRIQSDVIRAVESESDPSAPMIATVYVGVRLFVEMMQLVMFLLESRPDARIVAIACPCITIDQEAMIRRGVQAGKIVVAAWCDCGGSLMTRDIRRAVAKNWTPAEADVQISPLSPESSVDLGA